MAGEESLTDLLSRAERAIERGLTLFRRIEDGGAFSVGAVARTDPDIVAVRDDVVATVQLLLPHLIDSTDAEGLPLDFDYPLQDESGAPYSSGIGVRGGKLCAPLVGFVGAVRQEDAHGCVAELEQLRERLASIQADASTSTGDGRAVPRHAPRKEPGPDARLAYRLCVLAGRKQKEAAEMLTKELGRPIQQYQVSRWCKQARKYIESGGVLPTMPTATSLRATSTPMAPKKLDLGPRGDRGRKRKHRPRDQ